MQTVGELVQVDEAGGHALLQATALRDGRELVDSVLQQVAEHLVVLAGVLARDLEEFLLSSVHDGVDLHAVFALIAELHHVRTGVDQLAEDRLLLDNLRVVAGVGGRRHLGDERV